MADTLTPGLQDARERAAWLRLSTAAGLPSRAVRAWLMALGSAEAVVEAPPQQLRAIAGEAALAALDARPEQQQALALATERWLEAAPAHRPRHLIPLGDPRYPPLLLQAADPPLLLHAEGRVDLLPARSVAVVGSRQATAQGLDHAQRFARELSQAGLTVVSGLAAGIDGAAHLGALQGPASTIAVVGTGLDQCYPARHRALAARIASEGLLLSELALGAPPLAAHFPMRNRLIAGLSLGTLVVEAAPASGSLITARLAADFGRDVFAIPGSILSPMSQGCHQLIQQGAQLAGSVEDILLALRLPAPPARPRQQALDLGTPAPPASSASPAPESDPLLRALGHDPMSLDSLAARTGLDAARLGARLLDLELAGQVARLPGGLLQRRAGA